ncbi:MAG: acyl carrier protein [Bacteroidales bacterium]|nr:acyl carrier protein [Bacteroidales bacterium]
MTKEEVVNKVNTFLIEDFEIDESLLVPENKIVDDIGIDSLDIVDIIVRVNEIFGFKLEKSELAKVKTLEEFYNLVYSHVE